VLQKLEKVPLDELAGDVRTTMKSMRSAVDELGTLVAKVNTDIAPELKQTLEQAKETLAKAQTAFSDDAPLQGDLRGTLREVSRAARSMRELADYLERHPESLLRGKREESTIEGR
jgi:paraquat-inducible protein B